VAYATGDWAAVEAAVTPEVRHGDVLITMGAGNIVRLAERLVKEGSDGD
jgi:UDP-N-acetylmuramate-alanine ligase